MGLLKNFSITDWLHQFGHSLRRFPLAILLLAFLTAYLICLTHDIGHDNKWTFFYIFYPATGALFAVAIQLVTEDFKNRIAAIVTQVVSHAIWLGISLYLTQFERFSLPQNIAVAATVATMALSVFLACFYRKGDDVPFWNFAWCTLAAIVAGIVVGCVLTIGLDLFVQSLDWLFGVEVNNAIYADIPAVCLVFIAPLLAMSQIPRGEDKHDRQVIRFSGFIKGVAQYLFIPLLLLYMVTLYVYAAKIAISWQLPVGWVSYLVSASMLGMVILLFITYPVQHEPNKSFFKAVTRWQPLAMLPLLALMTVAIGRRLSDYGITVSRLYVLVFNIWCYVVCIGLLLCRNKRIWWVPASFAVVLFLISVGPQSIANVTRQQLKKEVRNTLLASGIKPEQLPLGGEQYKKWLNGTEVKKAATVDSKLDYLRDYYGFKSISDLLGKDAKTGNYETRDREIKPARKSMNYNNQDLMNHVAIPQGYATMTYVDEWIECKLDGNRVTFVVTVEQNGKSVEHAFEVDVNEFIDRDYDYNKGKNVKPLIVENGDAALVFSSFSLGDDYLNCGGLLLTK